MPPALASLQLRLIPDPLDYFGLVIPCAPRHEVTLRRHGIVTHTGARYDPVSAAHRFALHCARDDASGR